MLNTRGGWFISQFCMSDVTIYGKLYKGLFVVTQPQKPMKTSMPSLETGETLSECNCVTTN